MQTFPDFVTVAENRHSARVEKRDALLDLARGMLMVRFMAATLAPLTRIPTPAWVDGMTPPVIRMERSETPLIDVLADQLAACNTEALWSELVVILTHSAEGLEWLQARAAEYADFHEEAEAAGEWA